MSRAIFFSLGDAVFLLRQPTEVVIEKYLHAQAELTFTYGDVGATANKPPVGFVVDRTQVLLGNGEDVFRRAKLAIENWKQLEVGWLRAAPTDTPIRSGEVVAVVAHTLGLWSLSAARIVYVVDEPNKFGFAYGTLPGHVERGEERFLVERMDDGSVWYELFAFSRPRHIFTKIGYPLVRRLQKQFGRDSAAAMVRATGPARTLIIR